MPNLKQYLLQGHTILVSYVWQTLWQTLEPASATKILIWWDGTYLVHRLPDAGPPTAQVA